jgi:hypothetical protein
MQHFDRFEFVAIDVRCGSGSLHGGPEPAREQIPSPKHGIEVKSQAEERTKRWRALRAGPDPLLISLHLWNSRLQLCLPLLSVKIPVAPVFLASLSITTIAVSVQLARGALFAPFAPGKRQGAEAASNALFGAKKSSTCTRCQDLSMINCI